MTGTECFLEQDTHAERYDTDDKVAALMLFPFRQEARQSRKEMRNALDRDDGHLWNCRRLMGKKITK